jgi:hypothetical protein
MKIWGKIGLEMRVTELAGKPENSGRLSTLSQLSPIAVVNDLPGILNSHYYRYRSAYIIPSLRQHEGIVGFGEDGLILFL